MALGVRADRGDLLVGDAVGDESDQALAVMTDDTERAVPGAGELAGGGDDAVQGAGEIEVGADTDHGVEQRPEAFLGVHDLVDPAQQLLQQSVQADPRQPGELQRTLVPCPSWPVCAPTHGFTVRSPPADGNRIGCHRRRRPGPCLPPSAERHCGECRGACTSDDRYGRSVPSGGTLDPLRATPVERSGRGLKVPVLRVRRLCSPGPITGDRRKSGGLVMKVVSQVVELSAGDRDAMLRAAVMAPSMHNTQPWRFRFHDRVVEVYRDRDRELPAEDPDRRMLFVSLGAAIFNLRVEAAARGYGSQVRHLMDQQRPDLVAVVELGDLRSERLELLAPYLIHRRTNRQPFTAQRLPAQVRAELALGARIEGAELQWLDQPLRRWWLRMATNDAAATDDRDAIRTTERRRWVGGDRHVDGVPSTALGPRSAGGDATVRDLAATDADATRPAARFEPEPQLAVLSTRYDGPMDWLRAGQALERVLLEAAAHGVSTSMLNQVLEHEELRRELDDPLEPGSCPQAVIRFGYGSPVPPTPRRTLADVMMPDDLVAGQQ